MQRKWNGGDRNEKWEMPSSNQPTNLELCLVDRSGIVDIHSLKEDTKIVGAAAAAGIMSHHTIHTSALSLSLSLSLASRRRRR